VIEADGVSVADTVLQHDMTV